MKHLPRRLVVVGVTAPALLLAAVTSASAQEISTPVLDELGNIVGSTITVTEPYYAIVALDERQFSILLAIGLIGLFFTIASFVLTHSAPFRLKGRTREL